MMDIAQTTPVTLLLVGIAGIFHITLMALVFTTRHKMKDASVTGNEKELTCKIRAHANFSENVPLLLLILFVLELNGFNQWILFIFGCLLIIARLIHAYGMLIMETKTPQSFKGRFYGTMGTVTLIITGSLFCLYSFLLG